MIYERAQEIIDLANRKKILQKQVQQLQGFKTRNHELAAAVESVTHPLASLEAFRKKGVSTPSFDNEANALLSKVDEVESNFKKHPEWILNSASYKPQQFFTAVDSLSNAISATAGLLWSEYTRQRIPQTNNELLGLLSKIKDLRKTVDNIRAFSTKLEAMRSRVPINVDDFSAFEGVTESLTNEWDRLGSNEVPEAVLEFMKTSSTTGASLDMHTQEVSRWLEEHHISDSFRIRTID